MVRVKIHLEQRRLIQIFVASLDMNPCLLQVIGLDQDSLRGRKLNQYKSIAFYNADLQFWNSVNFANLLKVIIIQARVFYSKIRHLQISHETTCNNWMTYRL